MLQYKTFTQKLQTGTRKTGRRLHTVSMKHNQAQTETERTRYRYKMNTNKVTTGD